MDDFLILSPCTPSSVVPFPDHHHANTPTLPPSHQKKLQSLLQCQPNHPWAYAIFWKTFNHDDGRLALTWADGYFLENPNKPQLIRSHNDDEAWFYTISLTRSFTLGDGSAPAKALASNSVVWLTGAHNFLSFDCSRAKEASIHGLQTLVCVPASDGVVEMGSFHVLHQTESDLTHQVQSLFGCGSSSSSSSAAAASSSSLFSPALVPQPYETQWDMFSFGGLLEEERTNTGVPTFDQQHKKFGKTHR
ncbi:putative transcription factor MYC/MYB [Helianthus debilis subsp. tardiflorus]